MQKHKFSGIEYSRPQQLPCQINLTDWCTCDHQCNSFAQVTNTLFYRKEEKIELETLFKWSADQPGPVCSGQG